MSNIMTTVTVDVPKVYVPEHAVEYPERTKRHLQYLRVSDMGVFPGTPLGPFPSSPVQD
jgi:hypothetical protein